MRRAWLCAPSLLVCSLACAHPGARPGEAFTFRFTVGPVEGGRARMVVGTPLVRDGRRTLAVRGEAETGEFVSLLAHVRDEYLVVLDADRLLPLEVREDESGLHQRRLRSRVDGRNATVDYWSPTKQDKRQRVLPRPVRDPLAGFFALRALPLADGDNLEMDILDGAALWRVRLTVRREKLHLEREPTGTQARRAIRIDGDCLRIDDSGRSRGQPPRHIVIFLGDDAARPLLRLEADTELGRCALDLTSYLPPRSPGEEPTPELPGVVTARRE